MQHQHAWGAAGWAGALQAACAGGLILRCGKHNHPGRRDWVCAVYMFTSCARACDSLEAFVLVLVQGHSSSTHSSLSSQRQPPTQHLTAANGRGQNEKVALRANNDRLSLLRCEAAALVYLVGSGRGVNLG